MSEKTIAHVLADATGRPTEDFEPDFEEYPMPAFDDLEFEELR